MNTLKKKVYFHTKIGLMFKKIFLSFIAIVFISQLGFAQFRMGPIGGLNFNRQIFKSNTYRYNDVFTTKLGLNLGLITDLTISKNISLQSELLYTQRGGNFKTERINISEEYNAKLGYISMPVTLVGKLDVKAAYLIAGAGVYLEKLIFSSYSFSSNGVNIESGPLRVGTNMYTDQMKPWNAGVKLKAGFELKKGMYCVAFYDIGTTDLNPQFTINRNKTFGVQLGYIFSLTEEDRYNRFENFYEF
jgi:hypothetical protein